MTKALLSLTVLLKQSRQLPWAVTVRLPRKGQIDPNRLKRRKSGWCVSKRASWSLRGPNNWEPINKTRQVKLGAPMIQISRGNSVKSRRKRPFWTRSLTSFPHLLGLSPVPIGNSRKTKESQKCLNRDSKNSLCQRWALKRILLSSLMTMYQFADSEKKM